jgi:hypothetical protein
VLALARGTRLGEGRIYRFKATCVRMMLAMCSD